MADQVSRSAQTVFDALLRCRGEGMAGKAWRRLLRSVRARIARRGDSLVLYRFEGQELLLPLSHDLPFYRQEYPAYSANLARLAAGLHARCPEMTFVDIGANVGDTLVLLRSQAHFPVLCVEGCAPYAEVLRRNVQRSGAADVEVAEVFVSAETGTVAGGIEASAGTARLVSGAPTECPSQSLEDVLRAHPRFSSPRMVKLDTDGFDSLILLGAKDLLARCLPLIFLEYDPYLFAQNGDDGLTLFRELREAGYGTALVYDNHGDLLLSAELTNEALLEDLRDYYTGRCSQRYMDLCLFPERDRDLWTDLRRQELAFFRKLRGGG
ncbi:MAG TPA: FkbM family methyltransferase [Armatimonadota bacterium]|jgi:FkbM family methyltransferase